jgi:hypothetical protein
MQTFKGTLQSTTSRDAPLLVSLQVDGDRIRMWSDRHRIGSWDKHEVKIRRDTIFRFSIEIDEEIYLFTPEDPAALTTQSTSRSISPLSRSPVSGSPPAYERRPTPAERRQSSTSSMIVFSAPATVAANRSPRLSSR